MTVCVALLMFGGVAGADPLPNGAQLVWQRLLIHEGDSPLKEASNSEALKRQLNLAHCKCSKAGKGTEQEMAYELSATVTTGSGRPADIFAGSSCNDDLQRPMTCKQLPSVPDIDQLAIPPPFLVKFTAFDIVNGLKTDQDCGEREGSGDIWVMWDMGNGVPYEFFEQKSVGTATSFPDVRGIDTLAPELPTEFRAAGGEGTIDISWKLPLARPADIYAFQALCARHDTGAPVGGTFAPLYQTATDVCGIDDPIPLVPSSASAPAGELPVETAPLAFSGLNPAFLCATQTSGTATSISLRGLDNDVAYDVAILIVDFYGNVKATFLTSTVTPRLVTDFWEDIHERGGQIEGGFCLIAETFGDQGPLTQTLRAFRDETLASTVYGRALIEAYYATIGKLGAVVQGSVVLRAIAAVLLAPLVALALAWHFLSLPVLVLLLALPWFWWRARPWLRHGAVRAAVSAGVALVVLVPSTARADDFLPYWQEPNTEERALADVESLVKWHVGIRIGPYTPDIDKQLGINPTTGKGPYAAMFGNYRIGNTNYDAHIYQILPMLDVDRVLFHWMGQWTVGGSLGYMQKTAHTYTLMSSPDDVLRDRVPNSDNTFRLLPFALTAGYRMTLLDEHYGIPIVPYVKAGLSYYAWWISGPDGSLAKVCENGQSTDKSPGCPVNTARGGSLGFQTSVGLSIRAERIDVDAARSMQQSGIYHAGFFGELSYARVDGFGSSSKLSVGGATWFAGVEFEF
ncbi:MAG: hypothetical protein KIT31_04675 [Deltaproteobacteria bacterium]|nr:hypothetical protein [Deltaproteobacteria bacterium]